MAVGLALALLLNRPIWLRPLWRTVFFLPTVVPLAVLAATWLWLYDPGFGLINYLLRRVGLPPASGSTARRQPWEPSS